MWSSGALAAVEGMALGPGTSSCDCKTAASGSQRGAVIVGDAGFGPAGLIGSVIDAVIVLLVHDRPAARRSIPRDAGRGPA